METKLKKAKLLLNQVKLIDQNDINTILEKAEDHPKSRLPILLNDSFDEIPQRFVNCLTKFTYVRPHNHIHTGNFELMSWLSGSVDVLFFDEDGYVLDRIEMSDNGVKLIELSPNIYHTFVTDSHAAYLEVRNCSYEPLFDRTYATWSVPEMDERAQDYLTTLKTLKKQDNANISVLENI